MKNTVKLLGLTLLAGIAGAATFAILSPNPDVYIQRGDSASGYNRVADVRPVPSAAINGDFITASAASTPCVVFIKTSTEVNYMDWFFSMGTRTEVETGSGVIFSPDGYIITNNHVVGKSENIEVIHEKRSYKAKVIGKDPSSDLAVLKIEGKNLPSIKFGDSRKVAVGEWVLAVGNPFNLNSTVTAGIVSAKGRNLNIVNSQFPIESFIQTDAAINPGNSGGALVNLRGELIGINTAIYSRTGSYSGYGFAVPSDIVMKVVRDLIKHGETQKAIFGADVADLNDQIGAKYDITDLNGVLVTFTTKDGPADKAGIEVGDVIVKVDEVPVQSKANFDEEIAYHSPGETLKLTYRRGKTLKTAEVRLTNVEGGTGIIKREIVTSKTLGAQLEALNKVERERLRIAGGVRVIALTGRGILSQMGLGEGTIISSINGQTVSSPEELEEKLKNLNGRVQMEMVQPNGQRLSYQFMMY